MGRSINNEPTSRIILILLLSLCVISNLAKSHKQSNLFEIFWFVCTSGGQQVLVSPSVISQAWKHFQNTNHYSRRAVQGRRRAITQQHDRFLRLSVMRSRRSTARYFQEELQQATGVHISDQTVRYRLYGAGMRANTDNLSEKSYVTKGIDLNVSTFMHNKQHSSEKKHCIP